MAKVLALCLRGRIGYFGKCQTPLVLRSLEEWTRRRLRSVSWNQRKRGIVWCVELRKRGVNPRLSATTAGNGPSHLALSKALAFALPGAYFDWLGIPRLTVG